VGVSKRRAWNCVSIGLGENIMGEADSLGGNIPYESSFFSFLIDF
jgi:hypothetical protein